MDMEDEMKKISAIFLVSVMLGAAQAQISTYPMGVSSAQEFFNALRTGVPTPVKPSENITGTTQQKEPTPEGEYLCQIKKVNFNSNPEEFVTFEGALGNMWLGNLAQGTGLQGGGFKNLSIPAMERKPIKLYLSGLNFSGNSIESNAAASDVSSAIGQLIGKFKSSGQSVGAGLITSKVTTNSNIESTMFAAGFNASYLTASVKTSLNYNQSSKRNQITALFVQKVFNVAIDNQGQTPTAALIGTNYPVAKLETLGKNGELAFKNQPAYVSNIAYGRIVAVSMESNYTSSQMKAALEASYKGTVSLSATAKAEYEKVMEDSSIDVKVLGGSEESAKSLIKSGKFGDYFTAKDTKIEEYRPIAYTLRYVSNDDVAAINKTTEMEYKECSSNSVKLKPKMKLHLIVPDDNRYDDIYGKIRVNDTTVFDVNVKQNFPMYPGQTESLDERNARVPNLVADIAVDFDKSKILTIVGEVWDYDTSSGDDLVAKWNINYDLKEVVNAYRAGKPYFEKTFRGASEGAKMDFVLRFNFQ